MKIKTKPSAKILTQEELALLTDAQLQAQYDSHLSAWMDRSNAGKQNTWAAFEKMDVFYVELQRRKYGAAGVAVARAERSNVMEILQRES